jgi:putative transposase
MTELKNRSIGDILVAVVDGLKGVLEAISAMFPENDDALIVSHNC